MVQIVVATLPIGSPAVHMADTVVATGYSSERSVSPSGASLHRPSEPLRAAVMAMRESSRKVVGAAVAMNESRRPAAGATVLVTAMHAPGQRPFNAGRRPAHQAIRTPSFD
jgi:hypothetical protein